MLCGVILQVHDEFPFRREKALPVDLDNPVTVVLEEFQDPPVEIIALLGDVVFEDSSRKNKVGSHDEFSRQIGLHVTKGGQLRGKPRLFLFKDVLIGAFIANAKELKRFLLTVISERHLDP